MVGGIIFILIGAVLIFSAWNEKEEEGFGTRRLRALSAIIGFKAARILIIVVGAMLLLSGLDAIFNHSH